MDSILGSTDKPRYNIIEKIIIVLIEWVLLYTVHNKPLSYCSIADTSPD